MHLRNQATQAGGQAAKLSGCMAAWLLGCKAAIRAATTTRFEYWNKECRCVRACLCACVHVPPAPRISYLAVP
jgi:hypothetical protein